MTEIGKTARSNLVAAPGHASADGAVGPLAAYLHALEARVAALEARLSASALMTPAHAAQHAQVAVKTILRAVRGGELPVAGHVGRSPRISRDALDGWLAKTSPPPPGSRQRRRRCGRKASEAVEAAWRELG
jgi:excisionase family DNA binding protein